MSVSEVDVRTHGRWMWVTARGGTRRQRGAAIAAKVRGLTVRRVSRSYSETYSFLSATYTRYEVLG